MDTLTPSARDWLAGHRHAVLVTLRADGSAQSSNVVTAFSGDEFRVSVTAGRAKTHNLRRDPRALVHVLGDDFWSYASVTAAAHLGPVSTEPGDEAGRDLLALHDEVGDAHPDPEDFFAAMVRDRRLLLTLRVLAVTGSGWER